MNNPESGDLHSPLSVTKELWPWCLALLCILTIAWTGVVAWIAVLYGQHEDFLRTIDAIMPKASGAIPYHLVISIATVTTVNFIKGGGIVVTARAAEAYFNRKLKEGQERFNRRRERVRAEIRAEGRAEMSAEWEDYDRRREAARAKGEDFDEPPPSP